MKDNPYRPAATQAPDPSTLHPLRRGICPVCQSSISHWKLFLRPSVKCSKCATEIALGFKEAQNTGLGCITVIILAVVFVTISIYAAAVVKDYFAASWWLFMLIFLSGLYSVLNRWTCGHPYPKALLHYGRIIEAGHDGD